MFSNCDDSMLFVVIGFITFCISLLVIYDASYVLGFIICRNTRTVSANPSQAFAPETHNAPPMEVMSRRKRSKGLHKKAVRLGKKFSSSGFVNAKKRLKEQISTPGTVAGYVYKKL